MNHDTLKETMIHNNSLAMPIVVAILIYNRNEIRADRWITGGTGFFVETNEAKFLVTANHVWQEARREQRMVLLGGNSGEYTEATNWEVISSDQEIDICTIRVPDDFSPETIGKRYHKPDLWPPKRATIGDNAFVFGFPAEKRRGDSNSVSCGSVSFADFVDNVSTLKFAIPDNGNVRTAIPIDPNSTEITSLGGMSGSPIFIHRENGWMEAAGVFIEGDGITEGKRSIIFGAHTDLIRTDGSINNELIPVRF